MFGRGRPNEGAAPSLTSGMSGTSRSAGMSGLIQRARQDGRQAGRSGKYDEWSLAESSGLPYLRSLEHQRNHDLAQIDVAEVDAEQRRREQRVATRVEIATTREAIDSAQEELAEARGFMDACHSQLDRIAMREARIHDQIRLREKRGRRSPRRAAEREEPPPPAHMPPDYPYQTEPETNVFWPQARWMGPHGRRMSERAKLLALLAIAGVEVPLMWRIFHYLEPQFLLSVIFTLPVSAAMVVVPHFAGAWYRARHATGADLLNRWVPLALLMPWALLAFFLGDLRRRVLLVPKMDARGHTYPSLSDHLDLNEYTVSAMFIALLLLTGGVAFMLGIANDHPIVSAYLGADERWRSVLDRLRGDRTTLAGAEQRLDSSTEQDNDRDRTARRQDLVEEAYAAAAEAYLDGVTDELANPTATDAAARSGERREAMPSSGSAAV